ncbi:carbohydrate sulfotransferase 4-like [Haliotis rubra]|uniref:carbohydrate sulfotransferase 4-like n=1 Tax=Haliotis rubra TaxID=36100 RepID=UPI001EE61E97|nr:carbohydrate sulfotransferase 4-like [Haliotis rubra]
MKGSRRRWFRAVMLGLCIWSVYILYKNTENLFSSSVQKVDTQGGHPGRGFFKEPIPCDTTNPCQPKAHTKVILLTYMRSGSTLTGDILSAHPDVFYFFEPLHFMSKEKHTVFDYLRQRQKRVGHIHKSYITKLTMSALLNCDFVKMDIDTLSVFHLQFSRTTKPYYNCLTAYPGVQGVFLCLQHLYRACYSAKVLLTKTVSLSGIITKDLMDSDSKLRVIHLIRDPRATIWSEGRFYVYKQTDFEKFVGTFCKRLLTDLQTTEAIKEKDPSRVHTVLFEHLAERPLSLSRQLYNVLNLPMMPSVLKHIRNVTMEGHNQNCSMCISKANSARASQEWRLHLDYKKVQFIDEECQEAYDYLGYKRVESKEVYTNLSIPLHTWPII